MNKKQKEFTQIFTFLFLASFVIINWNDVSWLFNYRAISGLTYDFFNPYQNKGILANASNEPTLPSVNPKTEIKNFYAYSDKQNSLEIPSIGIATPLVIGTSTDQGILGKDLNNGAVYYPGSVTPGEKGQGVILGHSAPPNWPRIKYDWIFTNINNLNYNDKVILYFNNREYIYRVRGKDIIEAGQEVGANDLVAKNNVLTLISCWPPGKDYKRIAIHAELVNE
ncbi:MAG: hypothetical protein A3A98_03510 [Candidatus Staskawiczbacteria bacterium RIFCSPLOWO2_01_FULL_40_39]|uniref:Sortase n=1 Tax=Candidatus Staskawiczbacteria bacterium RIFCSPHIGHO2_01_FULL_39_25 TaxID=1802202 RepID=A0A1G2HPZ4_9BACT|nr:MAG: hypothetical protein A2730_02785 [Candidatus Staskawiczbacteria bacterium RIFCSPHIGHO2_01_FULL_39_25]OGZ72881.1 MAG: hypothetical protein A3A98_03510 [Candidatus Staskawiczbacteria bacterium RIFCSPLOWO2_01_FULL_40_39]OGZ75195.1 MAG: hypothetical protein A3I87_00775 [Candidatus Staskawiczbacteria bacterium RIFCSPLOWO2_02_FULL_39_8]